MKNKSFLDALIPSVKIYLGRKKEILEKEFINMYGTEVLNHLVKQRIIECKTICMKDSQAKVPPRYIKVIKLI